VSRIVYVSGRLGAGKSSLAEPLAAELGYSLVTKDLIKETLHDAVPPRNSITPLTCPFRQRGWRGDGWLARCC
jgi:predicted kinase